MKKFYIFIVLGMMFMPNLLFAKEKEMFIISEETKYYKTIEKKADIKRINNLYSNINDTFTYEITKEEYDNVNSNEINPQNNQIIETTYKKLTSSILTNGFYYRYKAELIWKNMPSRRSYDIIGIGYSSDVSNLSLLSYKTEYCYTNNNCENSTNNNPQYFNNGIGTSFKLPEGNLKSLKTTISFDVKKKNNTLITKQFATADYSHATKEVSLSQSKKYSVSNSGIILNGTNSYYDEINSAIANWIGNW